MVWAPQSGASLTPNVNLRKYKLRNLFLKVRAQGRMSYSNLAKALGRPVASADHQPLASPLESLQLEAVWGS